MVTGARKLPFRMKLTTHRLWLIADRSGIVADVKAEKSGATNLSINSFVGCSVVTLRSLQPLTDFSRTDRTGLD
jgi:hypothetical protein